MGRVVGVVVAGGRGARLGAGVPKALIEVGGMTLLERARATLEDCCDEVVIAAPAGLALPVPADRLVADAIPDAGPLAGVVAALAARPNEAALVLAVDFPLARVAALRALLDRWRADRQRLAVIPEPEGVLQPLFAVYAAGACSRLARALDAGERSIRRAALELDPVVLRGPELEALDGGIANFANLNTPADRVWIEQALASRSGGRR